MKSLPLCSLDPDKIAIPDFGTGAMENWGLITYRETNLLYDESQSSSYNKQRVASVIAHELVHQVNYLVTNYLLCLFYLCNGTMWHMWHLLCCMYLGNGNYCLFQVLILEHFTVLCTCISVYFRDKLCQGHST